MGGVCLLGSKLKAQSGVAESPTGADFLHRSSPIVPHGLRDTHRGGVTRSDTLSENKGLVDYSGLPAGERTAHISVLDEEVGLPAGMFTSATDVSNVEAGQGQEGEGSSAHSEGMLYIEILSPDPTDTLWVTFWEHLLKDRKAVTPGQSVPLAGKWGNLFEGSGYSKVYEIKLPPDIPSGYFSLGRGNSTMVDQWSFTGTDRVRIRFDRVRSTVLFGGPMADFYRVQYLVAQAFSEMSFNRDPMMVTDAREGMFSDSVSKVLYQTAQNRPADIFVKANVLVENQDRWELFERLVIKDVVDLPAWGVLQDYQERLTTDQYLRLKGRIVGEVLKQGLTWAELAREALRNDPSKQEILKAWKASLKLEQVSDPHPLLIQGESRWIGLMANLSDKPYIEVWKDTSSPRKEEILTLYLLEHFNMLGEEFPSLVKQGLDEVQSPWLLSRIEALDTLHQSRLVSAGLTGMDGQPVDLTAYQGKTLLLHFWITGCKFCMADYQSVIKDLAEKYASSPDVMLVSINVDRKETTWAKGLESGKYSSPQMLNLKASPDSGMAAYYRIHSFPQKMIVDAGSHIRVQTIRKPDKTQLIDLLDSIQSLHPAISPPQTF